MSLAIALITCDVNFTEEKLLNFVESTGGYITDWKNGNKSGHYWDEKRDGQISIDFDASLLADIEEGYEESIKRLTQALGGKKPLHSFVVEPMSAPGSTRLMIDFALSCMNVWPCVACTLTENLNILMKKDVIYMKKEGINSFPT